ncbi:hypothetical protein G7008_03460 [Pseudomonas psychrotolerans]|uniref:hypothetical protein n=1 Tax=Pseudomonas oryzihabitans TaxID=47885 RepID=UPI0015E2A62C|nr:hypothetical protein [Pseudomonas psychrotolerans]MBA1179554.1 hypothetical protein [Pseudomonas psychrotolerans]MBA1212157.1 hypothetical protein [Pseudomonas psychrotolerans]
MNHPAQDLAGLARQILGHSLVVFLSHHDEAQQAAPENARELIAEINALAAERLAAASDEDLRRRRMVLQSLYTNAASTAHACRGYQSSRRPGSRLGGRVWKDRSSVNKAGEQKAQRDMSRALGEMEDIQKEIDRRANAQAARA